MKKLLKYLLTCLIVALIIAPVVNPDLFSDPGYFWLTIQFSLIYTISGLYGTIALFKYLEKKYDWIKNLWKRLIIGFILVEGWSVLIYLLITPILVKIYFNASWEEIINQLIQNIKYPLFTGIPGMLVLSAIELFKNWKRSYLKEQKLKAEMMTYKYEALHNQLNPHFLFNSLNVLSSLVFEDKKLAEKFIDQLSDLYSRVLKEKDKELIPLSEELEFIESYIFLLKTRFENKLDIKIELHPKKNEFIAPMVLQLLIENAVKHNTISTAEPLQISVRREGQFIKTSNNLRIKKVGDESSGMGLENIKQRYSFFTKLPIEIEQTKDDFTVRIPILNQIA